VPFSLLDLSATACLAQAGVGTLLQFLPFVAIMVLAYMMFVVPQQQKERRYREMVEGLKEKDHVVTSGGIYGVVTGVQRDQERVTLRIDEATGAKMRVGIWAISQVLKDEKSDDHS
jgi:preprotein translocase subunit YajC